MNIVFRSDVQRPRLQRWLCWFGVHDWRPRLTEIELTSDRVAVNPLHAMIAFCDRCWKVRWW